MSLISEPDNNPFKSNLISNYNNTFGFKNSTNITAEEVSMIDIKEKLDLSDYDPKTSIKGNIAKLMESFKNYTVKVDSSHEQSLNVGSHREH